MSTSSADYLSNVSQGACMSLNDLLQNEGNCALSGKWHLGDSIRPQCGFSRWFTIGRGGCSYYHSDVVENSNVHFTDGYLTDIITDKALSYMDELVL